MACPVPAIGSMFWYASHTTELVTQHDLQQQRGSMLPVVGIGNKATLHEAMFRANFSSRRQRPCPSALPS